MGWGRDKSRATSVFLLPLDVVERVSKLLAGCPMPGRPVFTDVSVLPLPVLVLHFLFVFFVNDPKKPFELFTAPTHVRGA